MSKILKYLPVLLIVLVSTGLELRAQSYFYFQDSPDSDLYDFSWMELTAPSELERKGADLRKFPVETTIAARQGVNSLRLKWKSVNGGNWYAIAAAAGWTANDISDTDTLLFFLRSESPLSKNALPKIFMEDVTNLKSTFHLISDWTDDLIAGTWTKIKIPMNQFFDAGDALDWTKVKTIGFAQNEADNAEHTLFIDDMRVVKGPTTAPPATTPAGLIAKGYDRHMEISWNRNPESDLRGYQVEISENSGADFSSLALLDPATINYIHWTGNSGETYTATYRVRAINAANEPSDPSDAAEASTKAFSDEELLDMVQEYTFRYFWDFGHEVSGLTRERNTSGNTVTSGGSGFGLMAIIVGAERNYIGREEAAERILTMLNFLENADRFHGAWSHWLHGETGAAIPFSQYDNGGDIVETAYVAAGLLAVRKYFDGSSDTETAIVAKATQLWEEIEWDWYRRNDSDAIYWHWSPNYEWQMNMKVRGWNEAAIVYLLAIASPTHGVPASLWQTGWAGGTYYNPRTLFGYRLPVGTNYNGPMFFAHYSFMGFDPNNIRDAYANYFDLNRNHALVQQAYCTSNPKNHAGYSAECWGITASDDPDGYLAHEPNTDRDNGTISPTAALASFPYTPEESMLALKHFYRERGDKIWDWMGFTDAFNEGRNWYADSYLAIDQGPIIVMIENYRTQLIWDLFMSNPEIDPMLEAIGFNDSPNNVKQKSIMDGLSVYPNPSKEGPHIEFTLKEASTVSITVYDVSGKKAVEMISENFQAPGKHSFNLENTDLKEGIYFVKISIGQKSIKTTKFIIN